jgi:hypothetical protein
MGFSRCNRELVDMGRASSEPEASDGPDKLGNGQGERV